MLPTPTSGPLLAGDDSPVIFDNSPDIVVDTTGTVRTVPSTESELMTIPRAGLARGRPRRWRSATATPRSTCWSTSAWSDAVPAAQVRVALLRHAMPASGVVPLGGLWTALVAAAT